MTGESTLLCPALENLPNIFVFKYHIHIQMNFAPLHRWQGIERPRDDVTLCFDSIETSSDENTMIVTYDNANLSPRGLAAIIAKRHMSGIDARSLISLEEPSVETSHQSNAADNESSSTMIKNRLIAVHKENQCNNKDIEFERRQKQKLRLQKLDRKTMNHVVANRKALREKQRTKKAAEMERQAKEVECQRKLEQKKQKLYGNIRSKILDPAAPSSHASPNDRSCSSSFSNDSSNGVSYHIAFGKKMSCSSAAPRQSIDVDSSAVSLASSTRHHKSFGKIPTYITDRKAKIEREEEEQRRLRENAPPAPGLVLMEETERLETLRLLEENEKQAREELRNIPFKMNHQRAARLRQAIDYRLKEIEDTRKIFSKDKVFVAKNNN